MKEIPKVLLSTSDDVFIHLSSAFHSHWKRFYQCTVLPSRDAGQLPRIPLRIIVFLHGLPKLLPGLSSCLCNHLDSGNVWPQDTCLLPTESSKPDGFAYFRCPTLGSDIAAGQGQWDLTATAKGGCINNRGRKHGSVMLHVSQPLESGRCSLRGRGYVPDQRLYSFLTFHRIKLASRWWLVDTALSLSKFPKHMAVV